jgi:hypothetical protein
MLTPQLYTTSLLYTWEEEEAKSKNMKQHETNFMGGYGS